MGRQVLGECSGYLPSSTHEQNSAQGAISGFRDMPYPGSLRRACVVNSGTEYTPACLCSYGCASGNASAFFDAPR